MKKVLENEKLKKENKEEKINWIYEWKFIVNTIFFKDCDKISKR